jgi:hypothetical protein
MAKGPATRRVLLGMPGYGHLTAGAALGLYNSSTGQTKVGRRKLNLRVDIIGNEGSLLANNFNAIWCYAINESLAGRPFEYFAMLHSDVEPECGWLDKMVAELERKQLDLLGAVVPIKDHHGLTSIALARKDAHTWRPQCRLTMHEVCQLPVTFTSEDVGYKLLLNTGCWVCKFDPKWATKVYFSINDRIRFDKTKKHYIAEVEPEDWHFSRQCHALKVDGRRFRIGATRVVKLNHAGWNRYGNDTGWGDWKFDSEYVPESIVLPLSQPKQARRKAAAHVT